MIYLLAETNNIQESLIAYFFIMSLIGFILIFVDKRRWKAHTERSAYMLSRKRRAPVEETSTEGEGEEIEPTKKEKKAMKKAAKNSPETYEYEGRIKFGVFLAIGILFGALGELLGMIFCRHKWYNAGYRFGVPALALGNIIIGALLMYLLGESGTDDTIYVTVAQIVGNGLCI